MLARASPLSGCIAFRAECRGSGQLSPMIRAHLLVWVMLGARFRAPDHGRGRSINTISESSCTRSSTASCPSGETSKSRISKSGARIVSGERGARWRGESHAHLPCPRVPAAGTRLSDSHHFDP